MFVITNNFIITVSSNADDVKTVLLYVVFPVSLVIFITLMVMVKKRKISYFKKVNIDS